MGLFNPPGITALTADVTATGPGSVAATLAATTNSTLATLGATAGVAVHGTNTNNSAAAGFVGEFVSAVVATPVTPAASGSTVNVASISLTAGDWDVEGTGAVNIAGGSAIITGIFMGISTTSGAFDSSSNGGLFEVNSTGFAVGSIPIYPTGNRRISVSTTTTVYLVGQLAYTNLGTTTFGTINFIRARRIR